MNTEYPFTIEDVAAVTGGRVSRKTASNWVNANQWFFPVFPFRHGHPRPYSRLTLIEAAIASKAMSSGIPRSAVKFFLQSRADSLDGSDGGWVKQRADVHFPELEASATGWFWLCFVTISEDGKSFVEAGVRAHRGIEALAADLAEVNPVADESVAFVLKISEIVARVDRHIASRG